MTGKRKDIWFPAKRYGAGWGFPITWQGWGVFTGYIVLMVAGALFAKTSPLLILPFILYVFVLTGLLFFICWKKGEKLEFRDGKKQP